MLSLQRAFEELCGPVEAVYFQQNKDSPTVQASDIQIKEKAVRGFKTAYVVFKNSQSLDKAVQLDKSSVLTMSTDKSPMLVGLKTKDKELDIKLVWIPAHVNIQHNERADALAKAATTEGIENLADICFVCGIAAPYKCSRCKKVKYCSQLHQVSHWRNGHEASCGTEAEELSLEKNQYLFPEFELDMEEEVYSEKSDADVDVAGELKKIEELKINGQVSLQSEENVDEDLLKMANGEVDKTLLKFKKRIQDAPDQVIRIFYIIKSVSKYTHSKDECAACVDYYNNDGSGSGALHLRRLTLGVQASHDVQWGYTAAVEQIRSIHPSRHRTTLVFIRIPAVSRPIFIRR
ncbi:unnamed protein product [Trichogramma brassicae]|uniref:MYND-type domain-containing protein n=1 Tax=Trichogramma brassicae TaxID=86971 RepID=A0A6H5IJT0_9HYME|nr:unnamed protein product [Trichogramma brassicae]